MSGAGCAPLRDSSMWRCRKCVAARVPRMCGVAAADVPRPCNYDRNVLVLWLRMSLEFCDRL